jgi:hypothetical protein
MPHAITHEYIAAHALQEFNPSGSSSSSGTPNKYINALQSIKDSNETLLGYARDGQRESYRTDNKCTYASLTYLGSFGPDFFYIPRPGGNEDFIRENKTIADIGHYNKSGPFMIWALMNLKKKMNDQNPIKSEQVRELAYWMGYMSHIAVDSVLHPYVNSIVQAYPTLRGIFSPSGVVSISASVAGQNFMFHFVLETYMDAYLLYNRVCRDVLFDNFGPSEFNFANERCANLAFGCLNLLGRNHEVNPDFFSVTKRFIDFFNLSHTTRHSENTNGTFRYNYARGLEFENEVFNYFNNETGDLREFENFLIDALPERGQLEEAHINNLVRPVTFLRYCEIAKNFTLRMWRDVRKYLLEGPVCSGSSDPAVIADDIYKAKEYFTELKYHWNLDTGIGSNALKMSGDNAITVHPKDRDNKEFKRKLLILLDFEYKSCIQNKI